MHQYNKSVTLLCLFSHPHCSTAHLLPTAATPPAHSAACKAKMSGIAKADTHTCTDSEVVWALIELIEEFLLALWLAKTTIQLCYDGLHVCPMWKRLALQEAFHLPKNQEDISTRQVDRQKAHHDGQEDHDLVLQWWVMLLDHFAQRLLPWL